MALWLRVLMAVGFLVGIYVILPRLLLLPMSPTWVPVVFWVLIFLGCARFVWIVTFRWYPAVKTRFGWPRIIKVFLGVNALLWLPGFCFARYTLNSITGVDAGNFPTALWAFTLGGIGYVWLNLTILCLGFMMFKSMVMVFIRGTVHRPFRRHGLDLFTAFCVFGFVGMSFEYLVTNRTPEIVANLVLMGTEFAHDRTCAASSPTRWVVPLKDRKEFTSSNVLVATYHAWNNISFKIDKCDDTPKAREVPVRKIYL